MFIFMILGVTSFLFSNCSLKIRMTSQPCNKYEHTTLSYLLSVIKYCFLQYSAVELFTHRNFTAFALIFVITLICLR